MGKRPEISIITIVYNRQHDIQFTIESVINQSFKDFEYIIIDGKSTDNTNTIIANYKEFIDVYISDNDEGIYDAMNKGFNISSGKYILFLNGGDELIDNNILNNIFIKNGTRDEDIIFGDSLIINQKREPIDLRSKFYNRKLPEDISPNIFRFGTTISHQSFIVKRKLAQLYNLNYKYSSDIDWMLNCMANAKTSFKINNPISKFVYGDSSQKHFFRSQFERWLIFNHHY